MKKFKYNMKHNWLTGFRIGELMPSMIQEVTPGDVWYGNTLSVFRMAPMDAPAYIQLNMFAHTFFVPHRQTFEEFEDVITGKDTTTPWPTITYNFADYLGWFKFGAGSSLTLTPEMNALPVRAYNHIINHYFNNEAHFSPRSLDDLSVFRVNFPRSSYHGGIATEKQQDGTATVSVVAGVLDMAKTRDGLIEQRIKERRLLYGEEYRDYLKSDYNIDLPAFSEDRPLHVARGKTTMGISEVVATSTTTYSEVGELKGHGITSMNTNMRPRVFKEHGILMTVVYARPRLQLRYAHDHIWTVEDKDELYNVTENSSSQQLVNSREVYSNEGTAYVNFGYLPKHQWLRKPRDTIAGDMLLGGSEKWASHVYLTGTPTLAFLQQVQDYDHLFQDQTTARIDIQSLHAHRLNKLSFIRPVPSRK